MSTSKATWVAASILAALVSFAGFASSVRAGGGDERLARGDWLAAPDVQAMVSQRLGSRTVRAIVVLRNGRPSLVLENLGIDGTLAARRDILQFQHDLGTFSLGATATTIESLASDSKTLTFRVALGTGQEPLRCSLAWNGDALPRCDGTLRVSTPAWPAAGSADSPSKRAEVACDEAFFARDGERYCKALARRATVDLTPVIAACARHAFGDEGAQRCLGIAAVMRFTSPPIITACDAATYGQESFLSCLDQASVFALDPTAAIMACDRTMAGDQATVSCIHQASRYPFDPAGTITACERATPTDDAALMCIRRGGAF